MGFIVALSHCCAPDSLKDYKQVLEVDARGINIMVVGEIESFDKRTI